MASNTFNFCGSVTSETLRSLLAIGSSSVVQHLLLSTLLLSTLIRRQLLSTLSESMADTPAAEDAAPKEPDSKKRARDEEDEEAPLPEMPAQWAKKKIGAAMLWYYRDKEGKRQGPFYPGQMRQWWTAGFFRPTQLVAPSFRGEVPRHFVRVDQFFTDDLSREAAFVASEGVALWPAAAAVDGGGGGDVYAETVARADASKRPDWLEDSLARQRQGIHHTIHQPVERENYN